MRSSYLPPSLESTLLSFRPFFSAASFENFAALVCGWILCPGVHTISRVIVSAAAQGLDHVLFRLLLPFLPENIEAAVDDALCHRTGPPRHSGY